MSADLHVHVLTDEFTEEHYKVFSSNVLGSMYFGYENPSIGDKYDLYDLALNTPNVWVGEVSWLKAALFDDAEKYIPAAVETIAGLICDDCPVIDDDMISAVHAAFKVENGTSYGISEGNDVIDFLNKHKGERAFTISW